MILITQSMIKKRLEYEAGGCGTQISAYFNDLITFEPSEAMKLGIYFEYLVTGALPRSGQVPVPGMTQKKELTAAYQYASDQAERVKTYIKRMGIKVLAFGQWVDDGELGGTIDMLVESRITGKAVIDLKYSGRVDDKWSEHGWTFSPVQKAYHKIQATHYGLIDRKSVV